MHLKRLLLLLVSGYSMILCGRNISAQANFSVPDSTVVLSRYKNVEDCIALGERLRKHYKLRKDSSRYDFEISLLPEFESAPEISVKWMRECTAKFLVDTAPVDTSPPEIPTRHINWITSLVLGRDFERARLLRARQVSIIPMDSHKWRAAYRRLLLGIYGMQVRPYSFREVDDVDRIVLDGMANKGRDLNYFSYRLRILQYQIARRWNRDQRDSATIMAQKLFSLIDSFGITAAERDSLSEENKDQWRGAVLYSLEVLQHYEILDSLRHGGPQSYEKIKRRIWHEAGGDPNRFPPPIGITAGKFKPFMYYPFSIGKTNEFELSGGANYAMDSLPGPGVITLLINLNNACRNETRVRGFAERDIRGGECWFVYGLIRRLKATFPDIDITIVTRTMGLVGSQLTLDSVREANLVRELWQGHHKLPVSVAVSYTPHFRISKPDYRRVDLDSEVDYISKYFKPEICGECKPMANIFVVSPYGKIMAYYSLNPYFHPRVEGQIKEILDPLMEWYRDSYVRSNSHPQ